MTVLSGTWWLSSLERGQLSSLERGQLFSLDRGYCPHWNGVAAFFEAGDCPFRIEALSRWWGGNE